MANNDFITPSLVDQLRRLLEQYSHDQILKELIQNAEDGGATKIKFVFVQKQQTPKKVKWKNSPILYAMKGPALCVMNDGMFSDADWKGIASLQGSPKENDPLKVGRFGLGFKSVFHITDNPVIVSGLRLMVMNPQAETYRAPVFDLKDVDGENQMAMLNLMDGIFGFSEETFKNGYQGSLFWFPLRSKVSELSSETYDERKIKDIFHGFKLLAPSILLFLKEIESVELFEKKNQLKKLLEVSLVGDGVDMSNIGTKKRDFRKKIQNFKGKLAPGAVPLSLKFRVRCKGFAWMKHLTTEEDWVVVDYYHGDSTSELKNFFQSNPNWSNSPYVSVGVRLSQTVTSGNIFCFLPLPFTKGNETGLPFHVNGFFSLSQDRHHLKWKSESEDDKSHTEKAVQWNQLILKEIFPNAIAEVIRQLTDESFYVIDKDQLYALLPNQSKVSEDWKSIIYPVYQHLYSISCIYTKNRQGRWISPTEAVFADQDLSSTIEDIYILHDINITKVEEYIVQSLKEHGDLKYASSDELKEELLKQGKYQDMNPDQKLNLLLHFLNQKSTLLEDLELLPLADGTFTTFTRDSNAQRVYICGDDREQKMFPNMKAHFVELELQQGLERKLLKLSEERTFQLKVFQPEDLCELLEVCLKENGWEDDKTLTQEVHNWLLCVWNYISNLGEEKEQIIKNVSHLYLLPWINENGNGEIKTLNGISILELHSGVGSLNVEVSKALENLGIVVFKTLPKMITECVEGCFVQYPTDSGLMECLHKISRRSEYLEEIIKNFNSSSTDEEKHSLVIRLSSVQDISQVKELIRKLELFTTISNKQTCLEEVDVMYFEENTYPKIPINPVDEVIYCSDDYTKIVAEKCGVKLLSFDSMVEKVLIQLNCSYKLSEKKHFMAYFMKNFHFFEKKISLVHLAKQIEFVENESLKYKRPSDLFNPDSELLQRLFQIEQDRFPKKCQYELTVLNKLGLRHEKDVTDHDIIHTAKEIERHYENNKNSSALLEVSLALSEFLTKHHKRLLPHTINILESCTCFCIAIQRPPNYPVSLKFLGEGEQYTLKKTCEMYGHEDAHLIGAVAYIARETMPPCLKLKPLTNEANLVARQLIHVSESCCDKEFYRYMTLIEDIYDHLNSQDYTDLKCKRVVWTGEKTRFQMPETVFIQLMKLPEIKICLEPYMYSLPNHMIKFAEWFESIGCKKISQQDDLNELMLSILHQIKRKYDSRRREMPSTEEVQKDLILVLEIVNRFANLTEDFPGVIMKILLPVRTRADDILLLKFVKECTVFEDSQEYYDDDDDDGDENEADRIYFVHPNISMTTAKKFCVPFLSERILDQTDILDMNFGQKEPLTTRIKNLLKDYSDGFTIPKELIQNADDAGATVVKFLYDERTLDNAQTFLFHEGMVPCQGPAFWAYNDAQFSSDDFENITKLAGATKMEDSSKIGRFGLGFNSVYNLTDVPSFISGETYVVFDPHENHLGKSGLRLNLNHLYNRRLRKKMKGQFVPFEGIFNCKIGDSKSKVNFDGTLFRFPLRNRLEALKSKIKEFSYSSEEMKKFLEKIEEGAGNLLMFTQKVVKVELYHLDESSDVPTKLMTVRKSSDNSGTTVLKKLKDMQSELVKDTGRPKPQIMEEIKIQLSTTEAENSKEFLISWSYGIGKALSEAEKPAFKGLLPVAATAIQSENHTLSVDREKVHGFYSESHLFCFLPLPLLSELPVHVNASFAVQSSRRELTWQNEDELDNAEDKWNKVLLEDAGSQSYIHMLTRIAQKTRSEPQDYYNIWPSINSPHKHDQILSCHIYLTICQGNYDVFLTPQFCLVSLKESVFLDQKLRKDTTVGTIAFKALQNFLPSLNRGQIHLIDLPLSIWENFKHAECLPFLEEYVISIEEFYSKIIFPHLLESYWLKEDLDKILLYGLNNGSKDLLILFSKYECIPTKPNGKLAHPSKLIHPKGELAKLFSESEECFPEETQFLSGSFNSSQSLEQLASLGMQVDEFSDWELLSERIDVALESGGYENIKERCISFLQYLSSPYTRKESDQTFSRYKVCPDHVREKIAPLRFLPRLSIRQKYAWCKKTYTDEFISATNGYLPELINLVGCILPIVDTEDFKYRIPNSVEVLKWLGVRQETDIQSVVENLFQISHEYMTSESTSNDMFPALEKSVLKMYDYILLHTNDDVNAYIEEKLGNAAVILQGTTMRKPHKMALKLLSDLSPYLYTINPRYNKYSDFFCLIGVTEKLTIPKILQVLVSIANDKSSVDLSDAEITCMVHLTEPLPELLTHNAGSQLNNLTDNKIDSQLIKLPDNENKLTPIKDLWFDDTPWLKCRSKNIKPLHEKFTQRVARSMGVQSKREQTVNSLSKSDKFFQFGQHEDLTNRIHRILEGYPGDESILKEILQNADDAGATEVIFIKDFRNLPAKSLPNEEWSDMQGPALCIYNDSYFTEQDLKGIQDLGIGTKRDDILKTGQYGVGFNVVYHITDAPSFWSKGGEIGEVVCIFDPHCKYVSMATQQKPGMMIDAEDLHETFADFHTGYLPMLTRDKPQGTLFRLPLRTKEMALSSKISAEVTNEQHIEKVVELLKDQVFSCMIFLENIKKVKIGSIREEELIIEYEVASTMSGEDVRKQEDYNNYLKEISMKIKQKEDGAFSTTPKEISVTLQISDNMKKKEDYLIVKRAGFLTNSPLSEKLQNAYENGRLQKLPRGGVAIFLSPKPKITGRAYCTLPLPVETGLPVHVNGQFALDHESRRNLWKGEDSVQFLWNLQLGKSLIVPAYISALQKYKLYPLPARQFRENTRVLIQMIQQFESLFPKNLKASDIYWKNLVKSIYDKIAKDRSNLFPVILDDTSNWFKINWVPVQIDDDFAGCFNTLDQYYKPKNTTQDATFFRSSVSSSYIAHSKIDEGIELTHLLEELEKILVTLGMKVLKSAGWIRQEIEGAKTVSPGLVLKFLKSHTNQGQSYGCILGELPEDITQTTFKSAANLKIVFEFVMKVITEECSQKSSHKESKSIDFLFGAPLLLRQNHQLHVFSEDSVVTVSKFCDLLPEYSDRFLSLDILSILEDYVSEYQPLKEWSIKEFADWCDGTQLHSFIGLGREVPWSSGKPLSESWLVMLWKFLNHHIQNTADDSRSISLENHLNPVKSFSILPVKTASNTFLLYPLSQADHVIDYVHLSSCDMPGIPVFKKTEEVLKNLRYPELHHSSLDPYFKYRACDIVANMKHPLRLLEVLYTNRNCLASIDTKNAETILQYFNVFKDKILTLTYQNKLKQLKLYETHDGKLTTLNMQKKYIRLWDSYPEVPSQGLQHWSSVSDVIILKRHSKLDDLFKIMGIEATLPADLYLTYILKCFYGFKDEDQLCHLQYIRDNLLTKMEQDFKPKREALIQMLTQIKFISYGSGKTVASTFYDNQNEVFQVMHELLDFPPPPFNDPTWKQFLIHAGLISKVSEENFVFFAETIAKGALSNSVTDKIKNQSQVLVNYLFQSKHNSVERICERIKNIKFLEQESLPDDDYRIKIYSQFGNCDDFIAFQDSYHYSLFDLIWSVKSVLKRRICDSARQNQFYVNWFKLLGISKAVDSTLFIRNMQNVCSSLTDKSVLNRISLDSQRKLFETYYQFLQNKLPEVREELKDLKDYHTIFLPDDGLLVPASSVILESSPSDFIDGYIFKAPIYYGKYFDVFEALGVRKSAIPDIYLEVLCGIEENCNGEKLDPNESVAVQKCIKQLNILWEKHADQKYELKNLKLFLPNQQNVLKKSTELVFIDNDYIYDRTKQLCLDFFIGYKCLEMEVPDANSIHRFWPQEYQMKRLSKIVTERLNQDCIQGAVYGELANEVSKRLKHDEMLNALVRLLKHDQHKADKPFDDEETMKNKLQTIVDIKVYEVKNLSMELVYEGKAVPNSGREKIAHFVESSQQNNSTKDYILYFNEGILVEDYELRKTLFALLKRILNITSQDSMVINELWSMNPSEISKFLDNKNIIDCNYAALESSIFPELGTEIPKDLHFLLNNGFGEFYEGEYVGFEVFDPDLEETKSEDVEYSPMYVYAKIIKKVKAETDEEFAIFSINVGLADFKDVYCFKIYKFHRTRKSKSKTLELSETMNEDNLDGSSQDITIILQEIRKTLMKAWKLPEKERKAILKRLILLWHPDKNLHNPKMATEITQKIFMYVNRLKNGLSLDELDETDGQTSSSSRNYYSDNDSYRYFYKNMNSRGRSYARNFQDYWSDENYNFHHSWTQPEPRPMPDHAVRWLRQAVSDLKAAEHFQQNIGEDFHNWVCYKCQQAGEKALKAVWYTIDGNKVTHAHNVYQVACGLPYDNLKTLALELQNMIGDHTRMRYPDTLSYPQIPNDVYNKDHSQRGCEIARKIVNGASEIINSNEMRNAKKKRTE
ncbi:hypothetical protein SNE40_011284 [Patella caerulea]|uniref:HEPN domain-containing protein n=1 Tax=Patella caerulea TaxID=87958 RepID=A0AAN8JPJ3_PATCE